jgi:murein L,D-transpeptidase YcbB/YkuD
MKPHRRNLPHILYPILLAAGVAGIVLTRRDEEAGPTKLPEDLTDAVRNDAVRKAVAAENDPELERFYQASGFAPVWADRREEAVAALRTAKVRGLENYLAEETEVALTKGLMRYVRDVRFGRWNPGIYAKPEGSLGELTWNVAHDAGGVEAGLRKLDPPFAEYRRLETALAQAGEADRARIAQTMDRWRWLPRQFPRGAILVNVPEFQLRAIGPDNDVQLEMRVVVGLINHQTPSFTADLKHVVFGPYWNVPRSILTNEIIPDIVKDRTYLTRNAYEVRNAEGRVLGSEVSDEVLAGLRSGELSVRQVPGPKNALGRVKFLFPNQEDVYLHDTPSRNLFAREQRAFSHGCVRVENPQALAEWVLRGEADWTPGRIAASMKQSKSLQLNLKETIPVFLLYHTVTASEDGQVHYWKDLYKRDAPFEAATTAGPAPRPHE